MAGGFFSYFTEMALGRSKTRKIIHQFGANHLVSTSVVDIWIVSGIYVWLQAPVTLEAISGSANDDASGTGARTIVLHGLDGNWDEIDEEIIMNGTSVTASTTQTFIRINEAHVTGCGTYSDANDGIITIRTSGGGATHLTIHVDEGLGTGESQAARFSVPRGKKALVHGIHLWTNNNKPVTVWMLMREGGNIVTAPFKARRLLVEFSGMTAPEDHDETTPLTISEYSDIYFQAISGAGNTDVSIDFDIMQVDL